MEFSSNFSAEERRLFRKRQAARIRQQRCRARKRQALLEQQENDKELVERAIVSGGGSENGMIRSTENSKCKVSSIHQAEHSPRSVFCNYVPHNTHVMQPPDAIDFPHSYPVFNDKRQRCWSYEHRHVVGSHYDESTNNHSAMYCRYHHNSPLLDAQPHPPYPRSLPQKFIPIKAPVSRYYVYPDLEPELNRSTIESESSCPSWVPPTLPLLKKTVAEPMQSKEEAAVDAILALNAGEVIVPPPKIQRVSAELNSTFQKYRHGPRPKHPGFYLTIRN